MEGVSFGILSGLDRILQGKPADVIQVIGGGARSLAWRQLLADATGARVLMPAEQESGCLGGAIQAFVAWEHAQGRSISFAQAVETFIPAATDSLEPNPALREQYDAARTRYAEHLSRLYPGSESNRT